MRRNRALGEVTAGPAGCREFSSSEGWSQGLFRSLSDRTRISASDQDSRGVFDNGLVAAVSWSLPDSNPRPSAPLTVSNTNELRVEDVWGSDQGQRRRLRTRDGAIDASSRPTARTRAD